MAWGGLLLEQVILAQVILAQVILAQVIHRIRRASPLVISFPANNALQQKHHAACPSTRLGAKYRPAIIK
ncbi:hypothetical protein N9I56_05730 [Alphaproteobacteria bacterium]|nr:hypothetical protein [Alphaproteobacteria bacterium]